MSLTTEQVKKIAKLSRIKLDDAEITHFSTELSKILDWAEQLQEVNTDDTAPTYSTITTPLPLRKDVVNDGDLQQDVLKNTQSEFGCFVVPKVVE